MSQDWITKYGPRRVRRDPPTLDEAIFAAIGITDDQQQQAEIATALMGLPFDEVLAEVKKQSRANAWSMRATAGVGAETPQNKTRSQSPAPRQRETIFPNPRRHPETDGFYQSGMTSLDLPRMVELVVAIAGFCSAGIFLALAMDAYKAESEGSKDSQPEA